MLNSFVLVIALVATGIVKPAWSDFNDGAIAVEQGDYAKALQEWTSVAVQGDVKAQYNLGVMHADGLGTKQNYTEAAKWYLLAAKEGYGAAQYNLGILYQRGLGVPVSTTSAVKWYHQAAENGVPESLFSLALVYVDGEGVARNYVTAFMWLSLATIKGHPEASSFLENLRQKMTTPQITQGQEAADEWLTTHW